MRPAANLARGKRKQASSAPLATVWKSAQVLTAFADEVIADPGAFLKSTRQTKPAQESPVPKDLFGVMETLREKLRAAEKALASSSEAYSSRPTGSLKGVPRRRIVPSAPTSMAELREQARSSMRKLASNGTLIGSAQFIKERGFTKQALSKAETANRVFFVDVDGERYFPAFFVDPHYDRAKVEKISKALGALPGSSKLQFFLNGRGSLGGKTPLEALTAGQYEKVLAAAEGFVQG